jgi:hypothetical protein
MESPPGIRLWNISEYIKNGTEVPFFMYSEMFHKKCDRGTIFYSNFVLCALFFVL